MHFRKDINGLRAIAVISVVLFHFKITGFSGGFSGVDIFFVISGYLMTGVIFSKIENNKFLLLDFYLQRAKRIIPALVFLCVGMGVFGFLYIETEDYRELLRNIQRSLLFYSNIAYSSKTNYFDLPTQENWLLHTWSLSVEWQFYIVYPIIILFFTRNINTKIIKPLIIILTIFSFIACVYYANTSPSTAFYFLPTRAWEMLAGGIVFLYPIKINKKLQTPFIYCCMLVILLSICLINSSYSWPSYFTLAPVLSTMCLLYTNKESWITGNSLFQFIGKISYSLYLWHWPFCVFIYYSGLSENITAIIIGIIGSLFTATISYFFIEKMFLKNKLFTYNVLVKYMVCMIFMGGILSPIVSSLVKKHPRQWLYSPPSQKSEVKNDITGTISAIVLGDSHAGTIARTIKNVNKLGTLTFSQGGCPILNEFTIKDKKQNKICHILINNINNTIKNDNFNNTPIFIVNRINLYLAPGKYKVNFDNINSNNDSFKELFKTNYINTVCSFSKKNPVYIVLPIPEMNTNVTKSMRMQANFFTNLKDISLPISRYKEKYHFAISVMKEAEKQCGAILLDPTPFLCSDKKSCLGSINNNPIYYDDNHLNSDGNKLLEPLFAPIFID